MLAGLAADTGAIAYMMAVIAGLGIAAKIINQFTLQRLVKAAGNMPKSTHRLIKLVRSKYEHACMVHDTVDNTSAFVEKYIYEYRGFLFRIHTWRQIETLSVWFVGILAALGASLNYLSHGLNESVYQYIAAGAAGIILLSVVIRLSDEPYKINAIKMYMIDYLENICVIRLKKQSQREREFIDVISGEAKGRTTFQDVPPVRGQTEETGDAVRMDASGSERETGQQPVTAGKNSGRTVFAVRSSGDRENRNTGKGQILRESETGEKQIEIPENSLPINIEGEPRRAGKAEGGRHVFRKNSEENAAEEERAVLREEAIRQILEEFLA